MRTVRGFERFRPWYAALRSATDPISILGDKLAAWLTPDPSTLFTTSTGVTPVTSASDPVGLRLDKSKGMELGPELVTSGVFSVTAGGTNKLAVSIPVAAQPSAVGYWVRLRIDTNTLSGGGGVRLGGFSSSDTFVPSLSVAESVGTHNIFGVSKSSGTRTEFNLWIQSAVTSGQLVGEVESIRAIEGNHALQTTPTARPLYQVTPQRIVYDGVDDALVTTFAATVGADCTVARAIPGTGASITTGVNIGTSFTDNVTAQELVIANAPLTAGETAALTAYLDRVAGV